MQKVIVEMFVEDFSKIRAELEAAGVTLPAVFSVIEHPYPPRFHPSKYIERIFQFITSESEKFHLSPRLVPLATKVVNDLVEGVFVAIPVAGGLANSIRKATGNVRTHGSAIIVAGIVDISVEGLKLLRNNVTARIESKRIVDVSVPEDGEPFVDESGLL